MRYDNTLQCSARKSIGEGDRLCDRTLTGQGPSQRDALIAQLEDTLMRPTFARRTAALLACAAVTLATSAFAQDKTVKIGVLNDMSSLYADIGGPNSVVAVKM